MSMPLGIALGFSSSCSSEMSSSVVSAYELAIIVNSKPIAICPSHSVQLFMLPSDTYSSCLSLDHFLNIN
jgi:hypothetical protein